jgi:predicted permease
VKPPALADWALRTLVRDGVGRDAMGDLHEEFYRFQLEGVGPLRSVLWYWSQTLGVLIRYGKLPGPLSRNRTRLELSSLQHRSRPGAGLAMDLRWSFRRVTAYPGLSLTVVASLTLGIGVTSSVFSAVNGVLLEALPYAEPRELVVVGGTIPGVGTGELMASAPEYRECRDQAQSIAMLAAAATGDSNLTGGDTPVRIATAATTSNFFALLGVEPAMGRGFRVDEAEGWMGSVAVISHRAWGEYFGHDPGVLGREFHLDGDPYTVIGVMPQGFGHPNESGRNPVEVWTPIDLSEGTPMDFRGARQFSLLGRLRDGFSLEESRQEVQRIAEVQEASFPRFYPPDASWSITVVPLLDETVADAGPLLLILLGSVSLVFIAIVTNVANLQLSRNLARGRDFAVRTAIGGTRLRFMGQLFLENLALGLLGCAGGIGLAAVGIEALRGLVSQGFPRLQNIQMDGTVIAFALTVSLLSVLLFSILPGMQLPGARPLAVLSGGLGGHDPRGVRVRNGLVRAQTAISAVLLVGAGLLFKSFDALDRSDLGFEPEGVLTMATWLPVPRDRSAGEYVDGKNRIAFLDRALEELEALPQVTESALTSLLPLQGADGSPVFLPEAPASDSVALTAEYRVVSDGYFRVMGIQLLQGRPFDAQDRQGSSPVAIVSQAFATRHFQGKDPLGQIFDLGRGGGRGLTIVGVVADVPLDGGSRVPVEVVYRPFRQEVGNEVTFVLKTTGEPESLAKPATGALQRADPDLPAFSIASMAEVVRESRRHTRTLLVLFGFFGFTTLALASLGVFGVVSFSVTRRAREMGVRVALGSGNPGILRLLLGEGIRLGGSGAAIGLLCAVALSHFMRTVLFEVGPLDVWVFAGSMAVLLFTVAVSSLYPALRATRLDPVEAIKTD